MGILAGPPDRAPMWSIATSVPLMDAPVSGDRPKGKTLAPLGRRGGQLFNPFFSDLIFFIRALSISIPAVVAHVLYF